MSFFMELKLQIKVDFRNIKKLKLFFGKYWDKTKMLAGNRSI